jgi:putative tricarboxylic transport membrane protein
LIGLWVSMLKIPYRWLYPIILVFSCIGIYTVNNSQIDVYLMVLFGVLGYVFMKLDCEPAPFILGFLLGPMLEVNFRRAMLLSRGDLGIFVYHPISAGFLIATVLLIILMVFPALRKKKDQAVLEGE